MSSTPGELIDFTAEALHRRWEQYNALGEDDHCAALSALIEGYLDGTFKVKWVDGEPLFEAVRNYDDFDPWSTPEVAALMAMIAGETDEE